VLLPAGQAAKAFVAELIAGKKFALYTRWASALGSSKLPRHYAVIEVDGRGLADLLVENGLARLHGTKVNHPHGAKAADYLATLQALEDAAIRGKKGAWEAG
jgi:endonuclease YncB( thermonuclease family)